MDQRALNSKLRQQTKQAREATARLACLERVTAGEPLDSEHYARVVSEYYQAWSSAAATFGALQARLSDTPEK